MNRRHGRTALKKCRTSFHTRAICDLIGNIYSLEFITGACELPLTLVILAFLFHLRASSFMPCAFHSLDYKHTTFTPPHWTTLITPHCVQYCSSWSYTSLLNLVLSLLLA